MKLLHILPAPPKGQVVTELDRRPILSIAITGCHPRQVRVPVLHGGYFEGGDRVNNPSLIISSVSVLHRYCHGSCG